MDEKLLHHGIDNQAHCCYYFLYLSFLCSFKVNLCQFSKELSKLESLTVINICRISDSFMELRLRVIASMLLFFIIFSFFPYFAYIR